MTEPKIRILTGVAASPGYAIGKIHLLKRRDLSFSKKKISTDRIPLEISLLRKSLSQAGKECAAIRDQVLTNVGKKEAGIFDTHMMMLKDTTIIDPVIELIRKEHRNARYAFHLVLSQFIAKFDKKKSAMAREKVYDLKDIYNRVMDGFAEAPHLSETNTKSDPAVIVSHTLTPSAVTGFRKSGTLAILTDTGGSTSHVSILARSLQIPAVAGLHNISELATEGLQIIVDGTQGLVILDPTAVELRKYTDKQEHFAELERDLYTTRDLEPVTMDGKFIRLNANIELPIEAEEALNCGAGGIGLYRSEFLFFQKDNPTEEDQFEAYTYILKTMKNRPVTIRTMDAGGDKVVPHLTSTEEANPFMGWRSIRICLDEPAIFLTQLQALLRASGTGILRIMFPMITNISEVRAAKALLKKARATLDDLEKPYRARIDIGITVEVPAAVIMIDELAAEVDFLSIGTNDLTQFTLAVDRSNEKIAQLFNPHHPSILRMIKTVIRAGHHAGIDVSVCGEMASDPLSALLLIGMGIDELSMSPWAIMEVKKFVRSITYSEVRDCANEVLRFSSTEEIEKLLHSRYSRKINDLGISSFITRSKSLDSSGAISA